jgi:5-formyltetrahydrofolate cyclo-ligase
MAFKLHERGCEYKERVYGIKTPSRNIPTIFPGLVLVPLMCFNPLTKQRIGYGGGYYDEYIKYCR